MTRGRAFRLPETVQPSLYDVHLTARVEDETFRGHVRLHATVQEATRGVVLHARDITFQHARAEVDGRTINGTVTLDAPAEIAEITFEEDVPAGEVVLDVGYEGRVSRNMEGLYLSADGANRCLASQCEETDARAIYPCLDEPTFKARLKWTVTTDAADTVLANGVVEDVLENGDGTRTWRFKETKPMSTYLSAVSIGRFEGTPEVHAGDTPLRVWALGDKARMGEFGRDYAKRLLPWFEEYFAAPYHFDKYDQLAVPSFSAGAMENSGLVLFRESLLLLDPETASYRQEKLIARIISHEMAHMWFGNLVTMRWWDDLWLNEAFAEWMAHKAVHAISPEYEIWDEFLAGRQDALSKDALRNTHAIYSPVETPEQATELFDAITYEKGCAVMRMLENYLGEDTFRRGLRAYMRNFAERNAAGADLWTALGEASGEPVPEVMGSWVTQPGYPVVDVALTDAGLHVTQRRFFVAPDELDTEKRLWHVPVVARYEDAAGVHEARFLLTEREGVMPLDITGELKWVNANAGEVGFYRQALSDDLLGRLLGNLDALTAAERLGILSDRWALARAGERPITGFLDALHAIAEASDDHTVLEGLGAYLNGLEDLLEEAGDAAALTGYRAWVGRVLKPKLQAIGVAAKPDEPRSTGLARVALTAAVAGNAHDPDVVAACEALQVKEHADPASVDANLASIAVNVAAQFGDATRFEAFADTYAARKKAGAPPQQAQRYMYALTEFRDRALQDRTVGFIDSGLMPPEAWGPVLRLMLSKRHAQESAWEWMKAHWTEIRERLGDMWTNFLVDATGNLPPRLRDDMTAFYDANLKGVAQQSRARAFEALDQRAEFRARVTGAVVRWFQNAPGA